MQESNFNHVSNVCMPCLLHGKQSTLTRFILYSGIYCTFYSTIVHYYNRTLIFPDNKVVTNIKETFFLPKIQLLGFCNPEKLITNTLAKI